MPQNAMRNSQYQQLSVGFVTYFLMLLNTIITAATHCAGLPMPDSVREQ